MVILNNKVIGGYFEFELLAEEVGLEGDNVGFSSGRSAFAYLLQANQIKSIQLPYYTCDVLLEPLGVLGVEFSFYSLSKELLPDFNSGELDSSKPFVVNNYFGLLDKEIDAKVNLEHAIVDNSQALYSNLRGGLGAFNSYRKLLGVPDGADAFLAGTKKQCIAPRLQVANNISHLLGRIESGPEQFYNAFQSSDAMHEFEGVKAISKISERMFGKIDHDLIRKKRRVNYQVLDEALRSTNELDLCLDDFSAPLCYPLLHTKGSELRSYLQAHKIYAPMYWPNKNIVALRGSFEEQLSKNLVALPIDQRYNEDDMKRMIELIRTF